MAPRRPSSAAAAARGARLRCLGGSEPPVEVLRCLLFDLFSGGFHELKVKLFAADLRTARCFEAFAWVRHQKPCHIASQGQTRITSCISWSWGLECQTATATLCWVFHVQSRKQNTRVAAQFYLTKELSSARRGLNIEPTANKPLEQQNCNVQRIVTNSNKRKHSSF